MVSLAATRVSPLDITIQPLGVHSSEDAHVAGLGAELALREHLRQAP